jgi:hypothetical protein
MASRIDRLDQRHAVRPRVQAALGLALVGVVMLAGGAAVADVGGNLSLAGYGYGYAPAVHTHAASAITATGATLRATVDPNGENVTACRFEYGPAISFSRLAHCAPNPGSGDRKVAVSAVVSGLTARTRYSFKIVATNHSGTNEGAVRTFQTHR